MSQKNHIKIGDFSRIVLSETIPYDTPLIFTNNWYYRHLELDGSTNSYIKDTVKRIFIDSKIEKYTVPFKYKLLKNSEEFRNLGIIHPSVQYRFIEFYREFADTILFYCSKSNYSLRAPVKIATSYFYRNSFDSARKYKLGQSSLQSDETKFKHSTSFFSYNHTTKLHQFFDSEDYFQLESRFSEFWSLDISKCFESIYTHSIEWATKGKLYSKQTTGVTETFGAVFDKLMQKSNYNETNGIVIGNEVSRIFSEVILQHVDCEVQRQLSERKIENDVDCSIRRYVDDYFIFARDETVAKTITNILSDTLSSYKLFLNKSKTIKSQKPFITNVSRSKIGVNNAINDFTKKYLKKSENNRYDVKEIKVRDQHRLTISFINKVKVACYQDKKSYEVMCGYVIASLMSILNSVSESETLKTDEDFYSNRDVFLFALNVSFHLFNISPTVTNSVKLSISCYLTFGFFEEQFPANSRLIKLEINELIENFVQSSACTKLLSTGDNYFSIELANLLFISRNMGGDYMLGPNRVRSVFGISKIDSLGVNKFILDEYNTDYFKITACLYYIGDEALYVDIKNEITKYLNRKFYSISLDSLRLDTSTCLLLLDILACPYLEFNKKRVWAEKLWKILYNTNPTNTDLQNFVNSYVENKWFISWEYPDLWNTLEKKELGFNSSGY